MTVKEPELKLVEQIYTASLPHISNVLDEILAELKKINEKKE